MSLVLSLIACALWFTVGLAIGFHIGRGDLTVHPGIEIKLTLDGIVTLAGDSDFLHYCAKFSGVPLGDWMTAAAWPTCHGTIRFEVRALELSDFDEELTALAGADAAAAAAWPGPGADVSQAATELEPCPSQIERAAAAAANASAPVSLAMGGDTGAELLTERCQPIRWRLRGGRAIARIARRARSRSAR